MTRTTPRWRDRRRLHDAKDERREERRSGGDDKLTQGRCDLALLFFLLRLVHFGNLFFFRRVEEYGVVSEETEREGESSIPIRVYRSVQSVKGSRSR